MSTHDARQSRDTQRRDRNYLFAGKESPMQLQPQRRDSALPASPRVVTWHLMVAALVSLFAATAQAQTFTWTGNTNQNWKNAGNWSPAGGPPNAVGAQAIYNIGSTGITSNVNLPVTVGSIVVNQPDAGAANLTIKNGSNNILTFQATTGDATFTNQLATGAVTDGTSTVTVSAAVQLNSPLDVYSTFDQASNTAITFSGGITGNQTITLYGGGNLQLSTVGTAFTGQIVVNNGGVRAPDDGLTAAGNVTVNSGGQFQIGSATATNWSLGAGSVVYLNGTGKAAGVDNAGHSATRITPPRRASTRPSCSSPTRRFTSTATWRVRLPRSARSPSARRLLVQALTKDGTGVLILANDNSYGTAGPTNVSGGTLVLADTKNDGGYAIPGDVTVGTLTNTNPTVLQIGRRRTAVAGHVECYAGRFDGHAWHHGNVRPQRQ